MDFITRVVVNEINYSLNRFYLFILFLPGNCGGCLISIRNASKKSGGSSRNKSSRSKGKFRGIKKVDGEWVTQGTILVRQLGLDFLPGLNVS